MRLSASEISLHEGFLESAPQIILQLYIFLKTGDLSEYIALIIDNYEVIIRAFINLKA